MEWSEAVLLREDLRCVWGTQREGSLCTRRNPYIDETNYRYLDAALWNLVVLLSHYLQDHPPYMFLKYNNIQIWENSTHSFIHCSFVSTVSQSNGCFSLVFSFTLPKYYAFLEGIKKAIHKNLYLAKLCKLNMFCEMHNFYFNFQVQINITLKQYYK